MKNILCVLGIHRPLSGHRFCFGLPGMRAVYGAQCPCGVSWIASGKDRWHGSKLRCVAHNFKPED